MKWVGVLGRVVCLLVVYLFLSSWVVSVSYHWVLVTFGLTTLGGATLLRACKVFDLSEVKNEEILSQLRGVLQARELEVLRLYMVLLAVLSVRFLFFADTDRLYQWGDHVLSINLLLIVLNGLVGLLFVYWGMRLRDFQRELDERIDYGKRHYGN